MDERLLPERTVGRLRPPAALLVLLCLLGLDYWLFRLNDGNYLRWYLESGAFISVVTGLVAVAFDLDRFRHLISANPSRYLTAWIVVIWLRLGQWWLGLSATRLNRLVAIATSDDRGEASFWKDFYKDPPLHDKVLASIGLAVFGLAAVAWFVLVFPAQYFLFLLCGAPARIVRKPPLLVPIGKEVGMYRKEYLTDGIWKKPVTVTQSLAAAFLFVLSQLV